MTIHDLTNKQWQAIARENAMALLETREKLNQAIKQRDACREAAQRLLANVSHVTRAEYLRLYPEIYR